VKDIEQIIAELQLGKQLTLSDMPNIDLYMDQVIQLFENVYGETTRDKDDKVLTKTMINNYAKGKLLPPIKNKKYSREHLMMMSLIYQLKGVLSIQDIKKLLDYLQQEMVDGTLDLAAFYSQYSELLAGNVERFQTEVLAENEKLRSQEERILLIASLVNMSNLYRKVAEKLVDEL
jgi:DNA-binding transcriptional MerR regulator